MSKCNQYCERYVDTDRVIFCVTNGCPNCNCRVGGNKNARYTLHVAVNPEHKIAELKQRIKELEGGRDE